MERRSDKASKETPKVLTTHHLVLRLEHSEQLVDARCEMRKTSAASALIGIVPRSRGCAVTRGDRPAAAYRWLGLTIADGRRCSAFRAPWLYDLGKGLPS